MADILTWVQHSDDVWSSAGGDHRYTAINIGEVSRTPHYPWCLMRDDGRMSRVTNVGWCMNIAELCERNPLHVPILMHPTRNVDMRR